MDKIENVVDTLDSYGLIRKSKITGKYYTLCCPYHNDGKEQHPSSGILLEDEWKGGTKTPAGFFHCFACKKVATIQELVEHVIKTHSVDVSTAETLRKMVEISEEDIETIIPASMFEDFNAKLALNTLQSLQKMNKSYVTEEELSQYRFTCNYMYERGLTDELIEKYDIGFQANFVPPKWKKGVPCITFPVKDINGNVLFVARRSIEDKRFFLPKDMEKPVYGLYELPKDRKAVAICEGVFDALTLIKYGQPAIALFGTGTQYQIDYIKRYVQAPIYYLALDNDEAGEKGMNRLRKGLKSSAFLFQYQGMPDGADMNDLSYEQFQSLTLV